MRRGLLVAGIASFFNLGQLKEPDFSIKTALVVTHYPGARPEEVALEVIDRIERRRQEMPQIDDLQSFSRAGLSWIEIHIKQQYWADRLPQVWDELRRRIRDVEQAQPPRGGRKRYRGAVRRQALGQPTPREIVSGNS